MRRWTRQATAGVLAGLTAAAGLALPSPWHALVVIGAAVAGGVYRAEDRPRLPPGPVQ